MVVALGATPDYGRTGGGTIRDSSIAAFSFRRGGLHRFPHETNTNNNNNQTLQLARTIFDIPFRI